MLLWSLWEEDPSHAIAWVFWVILSICLHELGHGVAAIWQGDDTPIRERRMNLNPFVHMGQLSLLMLVVAGFAWGTMPVRPWNFRHGRRGEALVAAAGPAVNLVLAGVALTVLAVYTRLGLEGVLAQRFAEFLWLGGVLNLGLMLLNLVPVPPLDGSRVLAGLVRPVHDFMAQVEAQGSSTIGLLLVLFFIGPQLFQGAGNLASGYFTGVMRALSLFG